MTHLRTSIAGVNHRPVEDQVAFHNLPNGAELTLIPEPTNQWDPNAIKVYYDGHFLGYVPARYASEIVGDVDNLIAIWNNDNRLADNPKYAANMVIRSREST